MQVCHCGKQFSFKKAEPRPTPIDWNVSAKECWFCLQCQKFSHAVQEAVPVTRAPVGATALVNAVVNLNGQHVLTWIVGRERVQTVEYRTYRRRYPGVETEPLIFKTWELLQSKMPLIMDKKPETDPWTGDTATVRAQERAKYEARGIAEVLAILMKPFMDDADHVVKCAVKYYKDNTFEVPGLALHLWDPLRNPDGSLRTQLPEPKQTSKPAARPKKQAASRTTAPTRKLADLTPEEIEGIKGAIGSGMFVANEVANMFKVSVGTVELVLKS